MLWSNLPLINFQLYVPVARRSCHELEYLSAIIFYFTTFILIFEPLTFIKETGQLSQL